MKLILNSLPLLLQGLLVTVQIASIGLLLGLCGGMLLGILNCKRILMPVISPMIDTYVWIIRGTPAFVQILIVYYALPEVTGIPLSPFMAGVITLGMNSTAYISEIVRAGIDATQVGQWDAAYVLGYSRRQTLQWIILPQVIRDTLPSLTNEFTALIKETSLLMAIGVTELTKVSKDIVARELEPMTIYLAAALFYLALTSSVTLAAKGVQRKVQS